MADFPTVPACHRAHRPRWAQALGRGILRLGRWRIHGEIPADAKFIIAGGPHTSNWDFIVGMAGLLALDLRIHWLAKHSIFRPPLKRLFLWLGGVPVNRAEPGDLADRVADGMRNAPEMIIAITPEGTRSKVTRWKTGFLRIAAAVPCQVVPVTLDFGGREIRLLPGFTPGHDTDADIGRIHALFEAVEPRRPENF